MIGKAGMKMAPEMGFGLNAHDDQSRWLGLGYRDHAVQIQSIFELEVRRTPLCLVLPKDGFHPGTVLLR